jgi:addiction module RelB/DinJ family antitoxin
MDTAVINLRVEPKLKQQAVKLADDFGLSLSSIIDNMLRYLVTSKSILFTPSGAIPVRPASTRVELKAKKALKDIDRAIRVDNIHNFFTNL